MAWPSPREGEAEKQEKDTSTWFDFAHHEPLRTAYAGFLHFVLLRRTSVEMTDTNPAIVMAGLNNLNDPRCPDGIVSHPTGQAR